MKANWNYPTPTRFGTGRVQELAQACAELGIKKPLLVTDSVLAKLPLLEEVRAICAREKIELGVFSDIKANPIGANIEAGVRSFKSGSHDGVIAFGGGSALDAAKCVALMAGQTRPLWDFEDIDDWYTRVDEAGMAPVLAIPTTSGTGSEVGRSSLIVDENEHKKKIIFHPKMLPGRVICDPALTIGMPAKLTGAVGMDALSHNLEAYCSNYFHPMGDGIALEGMRLVHIALKAAYNNGDDIEARAHMCSASLMGAVAFQKGLGAMHAVGHAIGGLLDTHHGTTVAVMMPYVLQLNRTAIDDKLTALARYLGLAQPSFDAVMQWVLELRQAVGIPHSLDKLGVEQKHIEPLVQKALQDPTAGGNPIVLSEDSVRSLMTDAFKGSLKK